MKLMCVCVRAFAGGNLVGSLVWAASPVAAESSQRDLRAPRANSTGIYTWYFSSLLLGGGDSAEQTRIGYLEKGDCQGLVTC